MNYAAITGAACALAFAVAAHAAPAGRPAGAACSANGMCLNVTVAEDNGDPQQCGTSTSIDAVPGDAINYCYTIYNGTGATLSSHSLADTVYGTLFEYMQHPVAPGERFQYNRVFTATADAAPSATWTATDVVPNYVASAGAYDFVEVAADATALDLGDDAGATVQLPFEFTFYGVTSDQLCVNNNGVILFGFVSPVAGRLCGGFRYNAALPFDLMSQVNYPLLLPLWMDLTANFGNVYYGVSGAAPNRKAVVEWQDVSTWYQAQGTGTVTFEVVFDEASGTASFQYRDVTFDDPDNAYLDEGGAATIGVAYDTSLYQQYGYDQPLLANESAVYWTMPGVVSETASADVSVALAGTPAIAIDPVAISAAADAGTTATVPLSIGNGGDYDLAWNLVAAAEGAHGHFPAAVAGVTVPPRRAGALPDGGQASPAYGIDSTDDGTPIYVRTPDLGDPGTGEVIGSTLPAADYEGGTFVGGDLSTELVLLSGLTADLADDLYALSVGDASLSLIGAVSTYGERLNWVALRADPTDGALYAVAYVFDQALNGYVYSRLYRIDPTTGGKVLVGHFPMDMQIMAIAIDANGLMYGVDVVNSNLVAIDKTTAEAQAIGPLGTAPYMPIGLDFDHATGTLYLSALDGEQFLQTLYTVDPDTGATAPVGTLYNGYGTSAFAIASASPCATPANVPWLAFDPPSGTTAKGDVSHIDVRLDATKLSAGVYSATLCVRSNDPAHRVNRIPVTFTVSGVVQHVVTPLAGPNGAIDPATPQTVDDGATVAFTVTPANGYAIEGVTGCGGTLTGNTYATGPVTADCEVTATFAPAAPADRIFADGFDAASP